MTSSTYGGESNPKKIARNEVWWRLSQDSFFKSGIKKAVEDVTAVALCGENGFDARCAKGHGFSPRNITLVDRDPNAIVTARERSGVDANFVVSDFWRVARDRVPDILLFDDCALLMTVKDQWKSIVEVCKRRGADWGMSVVVCGKYGRDGYRLPRTSRKREDAAMLRARAFLQEVRALQDRSGVVAWPAQAVKYRSRRCEEGVWKQSPMMYMHFWVDYYGSSRKARRFARQKLSIAKSTEFLHYVDAGSEPSDSYLRECVLRCHSDSAASLADKFCISPRQVAAWRAVDTRQKKASA